MKKRASSITTVRTHSLPRTLGLNEWEKAELVRFELAPEDEVTTFSTDTLALYRALMLKFASACAPFRGTATQVSFRAHNV
jgi:hypothetical protein